MAQWLRSAVVMALVAFVAIGCSSMKDTSSTTSSSSRTAGETVDDAKITTMVKAELAKEKMSTLVKVDVDTNRGIVSLNGTVPDETTRAHATDIARHVAGVRDVVNNLKVQ
jgi:hyperosmotically inducible protein